MASKRRKVNIRITEQHTASGQDNIGWKFWSRKKNTLKNQEKHPHLSGGAAWQAGTGTGDAGHGAGHGGGRGHSEGGGRGGGVGIWPLWPLTFWSLGASEMLT